MPASHGPVLRSSSPAWTHSYGSSRQNGDLTLLSDAYSRMPSFDFCQPEAKLTHPASSRFSFGPSRRFASIRSCDLRPSKACRYSTSLKRSRVSEKSRWFWAQLGSQRLLIRPVYAGCVEARNCRVSLRKDHHEPLISFETFKIQDRLASRARVPGRKNLDADFPLLSG